MTLSIDTNLLIYAIDATAGTRHERARDLLDRFMGSGRSVLILQTLGEFYSVATRKLGTSPRVVRCLVSDFRAALKVHAADERALDLAMAAVEDHSLSFWDALLWATAERAGVRYLLSEGFQNGRRLGGVTFVNPFDASNRRLIERELPGPAPLG